MNPQDQIEVTKVVIHSTNSGWGDYIAVAALVFTIILAVIGWIISNRLQQKNHRQEQQAKISYDIYSQLVALNKETQDSIGKFNASTQPPIIMMRSDMIRYGGMMEAECMHKARTRYSDWHYNELRGTYGTYMDNYVRFLYITEDWTAPLASVQHAMVELRTEIERINNEISVLMDEFRDYYQVHGDDWRLWNEEDLRNKGYRITNLILTISMYINDFMVIVHNELLAPYYNHKRPERKTIDATMQVLTKAGFVTRVEDDPKIRTAAEAIIRQNTPQ